MGILNDAIREIALEKQAAEDDLRQALEDFDMITSRAAETVKQAIAALRIELQEADWWSDALIEDNRKPDYLSLSFRVRRYSGEHDPESNPDYFYSIKFDALGGAVRSTGAIDSLLEPYEFRAVARQDFALDLQADLKLFLKAILYRD